MNTNSNVVLLLALTPDDLVRKTYRKILEQMNDGHEDFITISGNDYYHIVMETEYEPTFRVAANVGDIVLFDMVTTGSGDLIAWEQLEKQKNSLEEWAKVVCERFSCSYKIFITANQF